MEQLQKVTSRLLDAQYPVHTLRPELMEMMEIISGSGTIFTSRKDNIAEGEVRTTNGLAVSPTMAAMCSDDIARTIQFIRGTHAAISDVRHRFPDRPVRVLYVGCGPYATLSVPLMAVYNATQATFTLVDVNSESIESAKSIVHTLGFADSVTGFETVDAGAYRVGSDHPPDIILLEILQACLEAEPQVAVTRHLLTQAPAAIVIPEEIRVDFALVDQSREFDFVEPQRNSGPVQRDRIDVTSVFALNRENVAAWRDLQGNQLPASSIRVPDSIESRYQPMLLTVIRVYQDHVLDDYSSGLTCPRILQIDGGIIPGSTIRFHYELGSHPGLRFESTAPLPEDAEKTG